MADLTELQSAQPVKIAGANPTTGDENNFLSVNTDGSVTVAQQKPGTGTTTGAIAASTSSTTLRAANTSRLGLTVYNDSTAILYLKLGSTASTTNYSVKMNAGAYYEVPYNYTGIVTGVWASATGSAQVTELT